MTRLERFCVAAAVAGGGLFATTALRPSGSERKLAGKVVLITGSSRGFGLAMAEEFARHGTKLVLTARTAEDLRRAKQLLLERCSRLTGSDVETYACDLSDFEQAQQMIGLATSRFGHIDILVNNAGIITVGPVENQPVSAFHQAIESNYYSMVHTTLAVLPQMLGRRRGSIVNITSIGGKLSVPHLLPYSGSKFATVGFSQGLHAELRAKGIRVTTVCPGLMRTGSHRQAQFVGDQQREYRWFSLGASLPGISTSASHAARKVVRAAIEGTSEIAITPQAFLAGRLAQLWPEGTSMLMHLVNSSILPDAVGDLSSPALRGQDARQREIASLTAMGTRAAERYNEAS